MLAAPQVCVVRDGQRVRVLGQPPRPEAAEADVVSPRVHHLFLFLSLVALLFLLLLLLRRVECALEQRREEWLVVVGPVDHCRAVLRVKG